MATSYYATGCPARFYVVPPWTVKVDIAAGVRRYTHRQGRRHRRHAAHPLSGQRRRRARPRAIRGRRRPAGRRPGAGPVRDDSWRRPGSRASVLEHPDELDPKQAADLQAQWVTARMSTIGEPAVLSGGVTWKPTQLSPRDMALLELQSFNESRIAVLLGVPPFIVGLPSGGDPMTYSNVVQIFDFHWRAGLRPKAQTVMAALSGWLLPRGTGVEVNRDAYVQPDPYTRAQTAEILNRIKDEQGNPAATVAGDPRPGTLHVHARPAVHRGAEMTEPDSCTSASRRSSASTSRNVRSNSSWSRTASECITDQPYGRPVFESVSAGAFAGIERRANRIRVNVDHLETAPSTVGRALSRSTRPARGPRRQSQDRPYRARRRNPRVGRRGHAGCVRRVPAAARRRDMEPAARPGPDHEGVAGAHRHDPGPGVRRRAGARRPHAEAPATARGDPGPGPVRAERSGRPCTTCAESLNYQP